MSGWNDLLRLGITLRPFDIPPPSGGTGSPFDASLSSTLGVLERELGKLGATQIVLQVGYRDGDLRIDGMPRASAKMLHDAVALSFESIWGPLRYETNEFVGRYYRTGGDSWQANLRAIALGMEALRKVDRYGVSKRGEQYTGYRQLAASTDPADTLTTRDQAINFLSGWTLDGDETIKDALTRAIKETHPDVEGGDADLFRRVMKAKELLDL